MIEGQRLFCFAIIADALLKMTKASDLFFLKNCRRVLAEAILEGWIEAEPGT